MNSESSGSFDASRNDRNEEMLLLITSLRENLSPELNGSLSDSDCRRFLLARRLNIDDAVIMVNNWWVWWHTPLPKANGLSPCNILLLGHTIDDPLESIYEQNYLCSCCGEDKLGSPVLWIKGGQNALNVPLLKEHFDIEEMTYRHIRKSRLGHCRLEYCSKKYGRDVYQMCAILDLKGIPLWPDSYAMKIIKIMSEIDNSYSAERLRKCLMINTPWYFTFVWNIIRPWLDEKTTKKIDMVGEDFLDTLREVIDDTQIPTEYGGSFAEFTWTSPWPESTGCSKEQVVNYINNHNISVENP